ncbi:MAG: ATP-binding protein, partial [Proteiniphilum sp.]|nr:ATP-binding protein [Proteiniphilum sp.]
NQQQNEEVLNLPSKIAKEKGIRIVVCLDEFQQIAEFDNTLYFQRKLRSVWQLHQDVTYCLYGSKQHLMTKLFSKQSMPFYKFGDVIYLQKISTADWIEFICRRFKVTGKQISPELAEKISLTVENHSSYVQQLAWLLWIQTDIEATETGFQAAYTDLLNQNSMLYFKYIDDLTTYQLNFLYAVADGVTSEFTRKENLDRYQLGSSANIKRMKTSLENRELIKISGKTISFNDPVFKLWFKKNVRRF